MDTSQNLEEIAQNYHLANLPDMHIEEACQVYELKWIQDKIGESTKRVLDLGFGDGINFGALIDNYEVTLVEGSDALCQSARRIVEERGGSCEVVCSFFENFSSTTKYDVILASHVLEHVDSPVFLLERLSDLLEDGGQLIGIVPNSESLHRRLGLAMGLQQNLDDLSTRDYLVGHQRVYSLSRLISHIEESGLTLVEHRGFFLKSLANSQMTNLEGAVLMGLLKVSDSLPTELCANIGFVCLKNDNQILFEETAKLSD